MRPIDFPGRTTVLGAPDGWDEAKHGVCDGLPILRHMDGRCISQWELTPDERAAIAGGANIWLSVWSGRTQPPVGLVPTETPDPAALGEVFPLLIWSDGTPNETYLVDLRCKRLLRAVKRFTLAASCDKLLLAHLVLYAGDTSRYGDVDPNADVRPGLRCQAVIVAVEEW